MPIIDISDDYPILPPNIYVPANYRSWIGNGRKVITGVTLHQAGCLMTDTPDRMKTLKAHISVLRRGDIVIRNKLRWFIWHAQGFSWNTIGIEFNGLFEGVQGDPRTNPDPGKPTQRLTDEQVRAANEELLPYLQEQFSVNGGQWKFVHAHRQSCKDRPHDPGSEIWQRVAIPWIQKTGATEGKIYGTGRSIPQNWR